MIGDLSLSQNLTVGEREFNCDKGNNSISKIHCLNKSTFRDVDKTAWNTLSANFNPLHIWSRTGIPVIQAYFIIKFPYSQTCTETTFKQSKNAVCMQRTEKKPTNSLHMWLKGTKARHLLSVYLYTWPYLSLTTID